MATISENLQTLKTSVGAIKQAISDRGGDVSGDISTWAVSIENMEGGGSSSGGAYSEVDGSIYKDDMYLGNWYIVDESMPLMPNTFYVFPECGILEICAFGVETSGVANEYLFQFTSGATATTLVLPDSVKWADELIIEPNMIYQVSILKGLASVLSWKVEVSITFPITLEMGDNGSIGTSLYSYLQNTYGEPASGTTLNEEIINNYTGAAFETIEYATYVGFTGYWLNGYGSYKMSWVLLEDGYLQRVLPAEPPV